jgi:hypothetical protein
MLSATWVLEEGGEAVALPETVKGRVGEGGAGERESWGSEVDGRCMLAARRAMQWAKEIQ